jgi:hypothetical protein
MVERADTDARAGADVEIGRGRTAREIRERRERLALPADVVCIQAGEAVVRITVIAGDGNRRSYELRTTGATSVVHDGVTIAIEGVEPRPVSARSIRPADYRLTLRVSQ